MNKVLIAEWLIGSKRLSQAKLRLSWQWSAKDGDDQRYSAKDSDNHGCTAKDAYDRRYLPLFDGVPRSSHAPLAALAYPWDPLALPLCFGVTDTTMRHLDSLVRRYTPMGGSATSSNEYRRLSQAKLRLSWHEHEQDGPMGCMTGDRGNDKLPIPSNRSFLLLARKTGFDITFIPSNGKGRWILVGGGQDDRPPNPCNRFSWFASSANLSSRAHGDARSQTI